MVDLLNNCHDYSLKAFEAVTHSVKNYNNYTRELYNTHNLSVALLFTVTIVGLNNKKK